WGQEGVCGKGGHVGGTLWGRKVGPRERPAGRVRAMGCATSQLRPGYNVAVEIAVPHCARWAAITRLPHPPACCGTLPAEIGACTATSHKPWSPAAWLEPLSMALYACHWAGSPWTATCCCVGLAPSGSLHYPWPRPWQRHVLVTDLPSQQLLEAQGLGADARGSRNSGQCWGVEPCVQAGAYATGWQHPALVRLGLRSLAQMPCWMPPCRRRLLEGVRVPQHVGISHHPAVRPLVTHQFPLEEALQALGHCTCDPRKCSP
uniref:Uncharacterized protein n=1 Tax=Gopherus agassizii TaxID=38772 RepID=A0A452ILA9_9SAUR